MMTGAAAAAGAEGFHFAPAPRAAQASPPAATDAVSASKASAVSTSLLAENERAARASSDVDELAHEDEEIHVGGAAAARAANQAQQPHGRAAATPPAAADAFQTPLPAHTAAALTSVGAGAPNTHASNLSSTSSAQGKRRRRTSPQELQILEEAYKVNALPSSEERIRLSQRTGMSPRAVQIWFQNKRQTEKRRLNQAMYPNVMIIPIPPPPPHSGPGAAGAGAGGGGGELAGQHPYPTPPHHHHHHHYMPASAGGAQGAPFTPIHGHHAVQGYIVQPIPPPGAMRHYAAGNGTATYLSPGLTPAHLPTTASHHHHHLHGPPPPPAFWASQAPSAAAPNGSAARPRTAIAQRGAGQPPSLERRHTDSGFIRGHEASSDRDASSPPARSSSPVPFSRGDDARWTELAPLSRSRSIRSDDGSRRTNADSGRLSVPLTGSGDRRPNLERSVSHSAASTAAFETPSRPKSSLGFHVTGGQQANPASSAIAVPSIVPAPRMQIQGGRTKERTLSRGILDEMCSKRELPYPVRKDSRESAAGGSTILSDKVSIADLSAPSSSPMGPGDASFSTSTASPASFALVTPVKQVQAGAIGGFRASQRSQLWDRMDSDPPSMSPAAGNLRDQRADSQSGQSDTDIDSDHSPESQHRTAPGHLRRIQPHILCTDADAEDDDDSAGEGGRPDKPTLRRLASLDYYAGTPAKRSGSLGAEVRRLGTLQQRLYISKPSQALMMEEPASVSDEDREDSRHALAPRQQSSAWASRPNLSRSASTSSSHSARSQQLPTPSFVSETADASRLMPDLRDGGKEGLGKIRPNEERDEECARLLLGLGMFGSGSRMA